MKLTVTASEVWQHAAASTFKSFNDTNKTMRDAGLGSFVIFSNPNELSEDNPSSPVIKNQTDRLGAIGISNHTGFNRAAYLLQIPLITAKTILKMFTSFPIALLHVALFMGSEKLKASQYKAVKGMGYLLTPVSWVTLFSFSAIQSIFHPVDQIVRTITAIKNQNAEIKRNAINVSKSSIAKLVICQLLPSLITGIPSIIISLPITLPIAGIKLFDQAFRAIKQRFSAWRENNSARQTEQPTMNPNGPEATTTTNNDRETTTSSNDVSKKETVQSIDIKPCIPQPQPEEETKNDARVTNHSNRNSPILFFSKSSSPSPQDHKSKETVQNHHFNK